MKKILAIAFILAGTAALSAQSEYYNLIEFRNKTGRDIYYLFFSPGDSEWWGPDVLGDTRTLDAGESVEFFISYPEYSAEFDFMAVDEDGNVFELYDMEINDDSEARIVINDSYITDYWDLDDLESELITLEINNDTGFEIYYLFISPSDSESYGIDFMDSETTLPADEAISVLLFKSNAEIDYDIQAVDEDDDTYSFSLTLDPDLDNQYTEVTIDDLD